MADLWVSASGDPIGGPHGLHISYRQQHRPIAT